MRRTLSAYANGVASYPGAEDQARYDERLESEEANVNAWSGDHQHFADEYDVDAYDCYDTYEPAPQYAPADQPLNGWEQLGDWEATSNQHATYAGPRAASPRKGRAERIAVAPKPRRGKWRILAILAVLAAAILGVATQALQSSLAAPQAGSLSYHWQRGYYLDKGWLCYGWANGAYHCTSHWHKSGATLVSDNPSWVPNLGSATAKTASTTNSQTFATSGEPCTSSVHFVANISQWTVPPGCYSKIYYPSTANFVYRSGFGWCNWWPEVLHPKQADLLWGGEYKRSSVPAVGAAVFFSGGVQGASAAGHYAEVVAISSDHYWVLVSEMNFYWRGGGWQKVDYRYIHVGSGVTFIYP